MQILPRKHSAPPLPQGSRYALVRSRACLRTSLLDRKYTVEKDDSNLIDRDRNGGLQSFTSTMVEIITYHHQNLFSVQLSIEK